MTPRALWMHVGLCVVALAFAWRSAHTVTEKKGGPSSVVLLEAEEGDVVDVVYSWDKGTTHVTSKGSDKSRVVVAEVEREIPKKEKPKKKDDHGKEIETPDEPAPPAEKEKGTVPAAKTVVSALEALEPLKTKRSLGVVDDERLKAMGLFAPLRTLTIKTKKQQLVLELGESSYGAQGRYARVKGDTAVHLIDAAIATGLEGGPEQLLEKRLLTAELDSIRAYAVTAGDKSGSFVHVDKDQAAKRFFAKKDDPTSKDEHAGELMTKLRNLRGSKLASADAVSKIGSTVASFTVDVDGAPVVVDVLERGDAEGHLARVTQGKAASWTYEITPAATKELLGELEAM